MLLVSRGQEALVAHHVASTTVAEYDKGLFYVRPVKSRPAGLTIDLWSYRGLPTA